MFETTAGSGPRFICDRKRHLVCWPYSLENLHEMAGELGLSRSWFHRGRYPHYDIPVRRIQEITARCTVIATRALLQLIRLGLSRAGAEE